MDPQLGNLIEGLIRLKDRTEDRRDRDTISNACNALRAADGLVTKHPRVEDWVTTEWAKAHPAEPAGYIDLGTTRL